MVRPRLTAGEGSRTLDVQLGKPTGGVRIACPRKPLAQDLPWLSFCCDPAPSELTAGPVYPHNRASDATIAWTSPSARLGYPRQDKGLAADKTDGSMTCRRQRVTGPRGSVMAHLSLGVGSIRFQVRGDPRACGRNGQIRAAPPGVPRWPLTTAGGCGGFVAPSEESKDQGQHRHKGMVIIENAGRHTDETIRGGTGNEQRPDTAGRFDRKGVAKCTRIRP